MRPIIFAGFRGFSAVFGLSGMIAATAAVAEDTIPRNVSFRNYFGATVFDRPVLVQPWPGEDSAFIVLQQSGAALRVKHHDTGWVKTHFDSIAVGGANSPSSGDDGGLLGFAFHPEYLLNRKYYVYYVASYSRYPRPGRIFLEERLADSTLRQTSGTTPRVVLTLAKPDIYHNGGTLIFGKEGFLYTAIGDGGGAGDPENRAQNKGVLFGKFLRLDVNGPDAFPEDTTRNYAIPVDNPFRDSAGYLPEIWAYGLRSPWKWSFHPVTGEIWMGDIGQNNYEEVTRVPRGANLGWRIREGAFCYNAATCSSDGLTPPVFTFPNRNYGNSVTGGVFFAGDTTAAFHGAYIFGDFGRGRVYAMKENNGIMVDTAYLGDVRNVNSFDRDAQGRVLAVSMSSSTSWSSITPNTGIVYVLESPDMRPDTTKPVEPPEDPVTLSPRAATRSGYTLRDVKAHPERYEFFGPDGRRIPGPRPGVFGVREKGARAPLRLFTGL